QRLMVPGEDGPTEVIEPPAAAVALVALTLGLGVIPTVFGDLGGVAFGAPHAVRPTHGPNCLEALRVVDEGLDIDHRRASLERSRCRHDPSSRPSVSPKSRLWNHHPGIPDEPRVIVREACGD